MTLYLSPVLQAKTLCSARLVTCWYKYATRVGTNSVLHDVQMFSGGWMSRLG